MHIHTVDKIFSAGTGLLGLYIAITAPSYGYADNGIPGSGFFPLWIGLIIFALSATNFIRSIAGKERLTETFGRTSVLKSTGIVLAMIVFLLTVNVVGILLDSAVLTLVLGWIIRPRWDAVFAGKIIATAVLFPVLSYVLFGKYLQVPLPVGAFGF